MTRRRSELLCMKCLKSGGVLTRRRAGNGNKNNYFYIVHYDPTKKSKKRSCYLGYSGLIFVVINDNKYYSLYENMIDNMITEKYKELGEETRIEFVMSIMQSLISKGWPKKFVIEKVLSDMMLSILRKEYSDCKGGHRLDSTKFNAELEKVMFRTLQSNDFKDMKKIVNNQSY